MSDMPETIWIDEWGGNWSPVAGGTQEIEYRRADLLATDEVWRENSRETFEAMCAMRDSINEHIQMPSLESDFLNGPESSVFCAVVAETVISYVEKEKQRCHSTQNSAIGANTNGLHGPDANVHGAAGGSEPATDAQAMANPKVQALAEAAHAALDWDNAPDLWAGDLEDALVALEAKP